jgi:hypothetical protein
MDCCGTTRTGPINKRGLAGAPGAMNRGGYAPGGVACASRRLGNGLGVDGVVPKGVIDGGEDLSRDGDPGKLAGAGGIAVVSAGAGKLETNFNDAIGAK